MEKNYDYEELFAIEVKAWKYGVQENAADLTPELFKKVLSDMRDLFSSAIENNYKFELIETAEKFSEAAQKTLSAKEVAYTILANLPAGNDLEQEAMEVKETLINEYVDAFGRFEFKSGTNRLSH